MRECICSSRVRRGGAGGRHCTSTLYKSHAVRAYYVRKCSRVAAAHRTHHIHWEWTLAWDHTHLICNKSSIHFWPSLSSVSDLFIQILHFYRWYTKYTVGILLGYVCPTTREYNKFKSCSLHTLIRVITTLGVHWYVIWNQNAHDPHTCGVRVFDWKSSAWRRRSPEALFLNGR